MVFFPANFMSQTAPHEDDHPHQHHPPPPLTQILYSCTPQDYHGNPSVYLVSVMFGMMKRKYSDKDPPMLSSVASLISLSFVCWGYPPTCCCVALSLLLGMAPFLGKRSMSFSGVEVSTEEVPKPNTGEEDLSDDGLQPGEKKRRLSIEQVKTLEKNFELCKKLEPERKMQLAQALRLQPRQIAIWFQNRRARWKTKQLEKDYDLLKRQYEAIKSDNEALRAQNQKLQAEIQALKSGEPAESINLNKETEGSSSNRSENSSEFKLDTSMTRTPRAIENHQLFPASSSLCSASGGGSGGGGIAHQLLHSSSSSSRPYPAVKEETYTNMFGGIDDQSGFWPWLEQQHFN